MRLIDPEQTLDIYITNLMEHYERCSAQSNNGSAPSGSPQKSGSGTTPPSSPTGHGPSVTTPVPPDTGESSDEAEPSERSWEDWAAFDAGVPRFGPI